MTFIQQFDVLFGNYDLMIKFFVSIVIHIASKGSKFKNTHRKKKKKCI